MVAAQAPGAAMQDEARIGEALTHGPPCFAFLTKPCLMASSVPLPLAQMVADLQ